MGIGVLWWSRSHKVFHTCANTRAHPRQNLHIPAPRQGTPAPELAHTCARTWTYLRQGKVHLRQNLDIPAPRQDTPTPRHGRLTPAHVLAQVGHFGAVRRHPRCRHRVVLAQASACFGAGHRPSWRKCGFRVGICARKWALAFSGGAGRTRFSTPAPTLGHTCANTRAYLRQNIWYLPMISGTCR